MGYTVVEELEMEIYDVRDKLNDCLETLKQDKELDSTQKAFLRLHNIIEVDQ